VTTVGQRRLGLAICPVVHLAALQEIQPILAANDNASEHDLIEQLGQVKRGEGAGWRQRNVCA
jgi:hypothetical protein